MPIQVKGDRVIITGHEDSPLLIVKSNDLVEIKNGEEVVSSGKQLGAALLTLAKKVKSEGVDSLFRNGAERDDDGAEPSQTGEILDVSDLKQDPNNTNRGTLEGHRHLRDSLMRYGVGRSILIDKNNTIIAGNKTAEAAGELGLKDVQVVDSDGSKMIAVRRSDMDINDENGRGLATADNVKMVDNGHAGEKEPMLPAIPAPIAEKMVNFEGNVLCIGAGSVWECMFPILVRHLHLDLKTVTIIDTLDRSKVLAEWIKKGAKFVQQQVLPNNFEDTMKTYLKKGDLLIDLAYDIACLDLMDWCREHKILYVNTSLEEWNYYEDFDKRTPYEKSLYARQQEVDEKVKSWPDNNGTTFVMDFGANPGLISAFMRRAIYDLAVAKKMKKEAVKAKKTNDFASLAQKLGIKVVLDTERDTQISKAPREPGEMVGTWSVLGLVEEGTSPGELGWGTHEPKMPDNSIIADKGPRNQIFISRPGMNIKVRSFVPCDPKILTSTEKEDKGTFDISTNKEGFQISGVLIRHGEAYTISRFLTTKDEKYRPTVYYSYQPCDATTASLQEMRGNDYQPLIRQRIMYDNEILSGADALGVMLGGYDDEHVWWMGSILNIDDARNLVKMQNATTIQVAIGVVAAICWAIENPEMGLVRPEDIDYEYILKIAEPYLGTVVSKEFEWTPIKNRTNWFPERKDCDPNEDEIWAFENFMDLS